MPGHGKTLFAVAELLKARKSDESRPLWVRGIRGLQIEHTECSGDDWTNAPDGAVIVIDEAQQVFPVRRGGEAPAFVRALETHRHRGIDLILITQHPALLDTHVRRLIDRHTFLFRISGSQSAMVYEWGEVQEDPRAIAARNTAETHVWAYPKDVYGSYSSAVLHTAKARVPKKLVMAVGALLTGAACLYAVVSYWKPALVEEAEATPADPVAAQPPPHPVEMTPAEWLRMHTPRVPHRPESAPIYDGQFEVSIPRISCVIIVDVDCRCYTEQATPYYGLDRATCEAAATDGMYSYVQR